MGKAPAFIIENSLHYKKGQVLKEYKQLDEGIEAEDNYLAEGTYIILNEFLSKDDERKIRDMIRLSIKTLLWNFYTKSGILIGNQ